MSYDRCDCISSNCEMFWYSSQLSLYLYLSATLQFSVVDSISFFEYCLFLLRKFYCFQESVQAHRYSHFCHPCVPLTGPSNPYLYTILLNAHGYHALAIGTSTNQFTLFAASVLTPNSSISWTSLPWRVRRRNCSFSATSSLSSSCAGADQQPLDHLHYDRLI